MFNRAKQTPEDLAEADMASDPVDMDPARDIEDTDTDTNSAIGDGPSDDDADDDSELAEVDDADDSELAEVDDTPEIFSFTVTHNGALTNVVAVVSSPTGWVTKRVVMPNRLTAKKLSDLLLNVANW